MEAPTHSLTGVFIQILCFIVFGFPFNLIGTILISFFSHFLIDAFSKITYHTPESRKEDKFWLIWHIIIYIGMIPILIIFIIPFWIGILFANLIDIWDWLILRSIQRKKKKQNPESKWGEKFFFHPISDKLREKTLFWLPNWNYKRIGIIPELLTITVLLILIILMLLLYN